MKDALLVVVVFTCYCYDLYSAKSTLIINQYAFKGNAITFTCENRRLPVLRVSLLKRSKKSNRSQNIYTLDVKKGVRINTRSLTLLSNPKNISFFLINLTNVQCSDAGNYGCSASYAATPQNLISEFEILNVLEKPGKPHMSLIDSTSCTGTNKECKDCRRSSQTLPAIKVGETIQIQCSNTVPTIGSPVFLWFYKDDHGHYHLITENVMDDKLSTISPSSANFIEERCLESQSLTSRLNFTPDPLQNYGSTLVLRCNTSYSLPSTAKRLVNFVEIEICLIGSIHPWRFRSEGYETKGELKQKKIRTMMIAAAGTCAFFIVLIGFGYYLNIRSKMNRELEDIKASKTSHPQDISFKNLKTGHIPQPFDDDSDYTYSTTYSTELQNTRRKQRKRKKPRLN